MLRNRKIAARKYAARLRLSAFYYSFAHTIYGLQYNDDKLKLKTHFSIPFYFRPYVECFNEHEIN